MIKYNTGENRALYIVACMRSASRYIIKMVVVKQGVEVHWWNDNDDKELESTIQIWVADKCQGIETEGLLRETVIAAWWGDELGEDTNIDESGEERDKWLMLNNKPLSKRIERRRIRLVYIEQSFGHYYEDFG